MSSMTTRARRLVHSMNKREVQHKFVLWGVILILFAAIILIIYLATK